MLVRASNMAVQDISNLQEGDVMKRVFFLVSLLLVLSLALFGCNRGGSTDSSSSSSSDTSKAKSSESSNGTLEIQFGSGTQTGVYYPLGATLAKVWNDNVKGVKVSSQATDASVQNLQLMKQGKLNMGLTMIGVAHEAYTGTDHFKGNQYKDVRVLAALYPNVGQIVARKGAGINSVADLKGKGFVPGAPGSSTKVLSQHIFAAYGLTLDDVKSQYVGFDEATELMRNKQVVGAQITAGIPASAVVESLSTAHGKLISIDDEHIQKITKKYPWNFKYTIPAGTYDGQDKDVTAVGEANAIVVSKSMPEDKVYQLTKAMWENIDAIRNSVSATKNMKLENAAKALSGVPLHPGAEKFYKEKGVLK